MTYLIPKVSIKLLLFQELFKDTGVKNFILSRVESAPQMHIKTSNLKGFDNIHFNDRELINHIIFKFEESIGDI